MAPRSVPRRRRLHEDAQRLAAQPPRPREMKTPMAAPITGSTQCQSVRAMTPAATITPIDPRVSAHPRR